MINEFLEKSLDDLENIKLDSSDPRDSLFRKISSVRNKKLRDLTVEDLALLLRQEISLNFIVPICIDRLNNNILAETERTGDYLITYLIKVSKDFWIKNKDLHSQVIDTVSKNMNTIINPEFENNVELDSYIEDILPVILKNYERFKCFVD